MGEVVYFLCALSSFGCAALLLRGYLRSRSRLLLWSAACFAGLFLNNALLVVDLVVLPLVDLSSYRHAISLAAIAILVYGLVWETSR